MLLQLSKYSLSYCMQIQYIIAGDVTGGKQRGEMPPWQSKCENRTATLTDISGLVFVWFSVVCCFCVFIRIFSGDLGFYHCYPQPNSPPFLKLCSECWLVGPIYLSFPPWLKVLVTPLCKTRMQKGGKFQMFSENISFLMKKVNMYFKKRAYDSHT